MNKKEGIEQFNSKINTLKETINEIFTLDCIKSLDNTILNYDQFFYLSESKYVEEYIKLDEGFVGEDFGYILNVELSDKTTIDVMIMKDTFRHSFASENTIIVDTEECLKRLNELLNDDYKVTELHINEPSCISLDDKEFAKRELSFYGLECGGLGSVDYESIDEVGQDLIDNIP